MLGKEIVGKEVVGSQGHNLGKVSDVQFDENEWKVLALEIHLRKDVAEDHHLRHRLKRTRVMIRVEHVQAVGDRVVLKGSKEDLLKLIGSSPKMVLSETDTYGPSPSVLPPSPSTESQEESIQKDSSDGINPEEDST